MIGVQETNTVANLKEKLSELFRLEANRRNIWVDYAAAHPGEEKLMYLKKISFKNNEDPVKPKSPQEILEEKVATLQNQVCDLQIQMIILQHPVLGGIFERYKNKVVQPVPDFKHALRSGKDGGYSFVGSDDMIYRYGVATNIEQEALGELEQERRPIPTTA